MIVFENVTKHYAAGNTDGKSLRTALSRISHPPCPPFTAVSNVNFSVAAGEAVGIVGGNGAGKSTLLKLLTRVTRPSSGRIVVGGKISSLLEVGAGFHHDLSGRENIFLAGAILGMSRRRIAEKIDDIVEFSELEAFIEKPVRTYSSGMLLRLAFSVGVYLDCEILAIDEAIAVGDAAFQRRCMDKIQTFRRDGGTIVLVTHVEAHLREVCDRALLMDKGMLVFDGPTDTALKRYEKSLKHNQEK